MTYPLPMYLGRPVGCPAVVDNAVARVYVPSNAHARLFLLGFHADYSAAVTAVKTITLKTAPATVDGVLTAPTLSRGSTDTALATTAFDFVASRVGAYYKAAVLGGTALPAGTIPLNTWGVFRVSIDSALAIHITAGAANFTTGYASEALALAALPAVPANEADAGSFTVLTAVGFAFVCGTDALQGGGSGHPSSDTNYYAATAITLTTHGQPFRWDFSKGPAVLPLPGILRTEHDQALVVELEASGTGGVTGAVTAWLSAP